MPITFGKGQRGEFKKYLLAVKKRLGTGLQLLTFLPEREERRQKLFSKCT